MLEVEPSIYKFGITNHIIDRLKTHYRDMRFNRIVKIYDCKYNTIMARVECMLKRSARTNGELINKYNKTEIIRTDRIEPYLQFIDEQIGALTADQPAPAIHPPAIIPPAVNPPAIIRAPDHPVDKKDRNKCNLCGKDFRAPAFLLRHKNKKTPCVIREPAPADINNPNRCTYCNKVYSKKENLTRHHTTCKVKTGKIVIPDDRVRVEQDIRILKETIAQMDIKINDLRATMNDTINTMNDTINNAISKLRNEIKGELAAMKSQNKNVR